MRNRHAQANAIILRKTMTDAERCLWRYLRLRQLSGFKFRRQYPVGPYIADFVCIEGNLIVELDGGQHAEQRERDQARTIWLEENGFRVLRFWNDAVLKETDAVVHVIRAALCRPHPTLPRKRGRAKITRISCTEQG